MASNPYVNKVEYGGSTLIDLTADDVTEADVLSGRSFHLPSGAPGTGRATVPSPSDSNPAMDGTASPGVSDAYARGDHVHPTDTSRQTQIAQKSISLTTSWSGNGPYTQTVTISGYTITANSKVDLQPDATTIAQLINDGVSALYISNTSGTLTAYAVGAAPTAALTVQCTITEVSA